MLIDFSADARKAYGWMASAIGPRPVAWVSTRSKDGVVNLAPFSFFQMITGSPPTLMISPLLQVDGSIKDTTRNIIETGEFVVNLVPHSLVEKMNETSFAFPSGVSEIVQCDIATLAAERVSPPRVVGVPVSFECRVASVQAYPVAQPSCHIILGEVLIAHIDDQVLDENGRIDPMRLDIVSRMGGDWYGRTRSEANFSLQRPQGWDRPPPARADADGGLSIEQLLEAGLAHHQAGRLQQAELAYRQILHVRPDHPDALSMLGLMIHYGGRSDVAYAMINRAISVNPRNPVFYRNLAYALGGLGNIAAAEAAYRKAAALDQHFPEVLCDLGDCLRLQGRPAEAEEYYRQALALKADFPEACVNLALAQKEQFKFDEAEASLRHAVKITPNFAIAHNNFAVMLAEQGKAQESEAACRRALELEPDNVAALYNLSNALRDLGRVAESEAECRRVLELDRNHVQAPFLLAFLLLLQGQYREGWQHYESRWNLASHEARPGFIEPLWRGDSDLLGKSILLYSEQGYGDTLQFCRYAKVLAARGARVFLFVPKPLKSLMERCAGVAAVVSVDDEVPAFDYQCALMSLPHACHTELDTVPAGAPYLSSEPARVGAWRDLLGKRRGLRVGLVWAGDSRKHLQEAHAVDRLRSIHFDRLRPLLSVAGVEFFSLQVGEETRAQLVDAPGVKDFTERLRDFHDTAALIENLDLVISVDTSVVHLAGGLGKPVWLLNRFNTCWRWLLDRADSPWYPNTRIFRQPRFGDWDSVIEEVKQALNELALRPSQPVVPGAKTASDPASMLDPALRSAVAHHQAGRRKEAEALYREILAANPLEPDALHFLGMLMHQTGKNEQALQLIGQAIAVAPRNPLFHCNLGTVLRLLGKLQESIDSYGRALALKEDYPDAHYKLGVSLQRAGRSDAAEIAYRRALALNPDIADAGFELANILKDAGRLDEAEACYRRALLINPKFARAYSNLGVILVGQKRFAEAEGAYRRALELKPDMAEVHNNMGTLLQQQNRFAEAEGHCRQAVQLMPDLAEAHNNLGIGLKEQGRPAEAEASYRRALEINPRMVEAYNNLGNVLKDAGRLEEAENCFHAALQVNPDFANAHMNYAFLLLQTGKFADGWKEFEYRWQTDHLDGAPNFSSPRWTGEADLKGKTITLHAEQGYGDTLQFVRYAKVLAAGGATVHLVVPAPLKALAASCTGVAAVFDGRDVLPPADFHCPLMSLPLACKTNLDTIPAELPYLAAAPADIGRWQRRLGEKRALRVGLAWAGNARAHQLSAHLLDAQRSIHFDRMRPLLEVEGIEFFSLQLGGEASAQVKNVPQVKDYTAELHDFHDTAALIENLDLVISVDTSVVHLAGALGKPVWMLNRYNTCWRWLNDRSDSPWYPTLRIFRQSAMGDWDGVIADVKRALGALAAGTGT